MNIQNLKKSREAKHLTQSQVAGILGITPVSYQYYEYGKREPNNEMLCKLAELFNVSTDYLLGREAGEPETIDQLANEFNMSALEKKILDNYLALPKDMRTDLMDFLHKSVIEVQASND